MTGVPAEVRCSLNWHTAPVDLSVNRMGYTVGEGGKELAVISMETIVGAVIIHRETVAVIHDSALLGFIEYLRKGGQLENHL